MTENQFKDEPIHQGLRAKLVRELEEKGIADKNLLSSIAKVKRHFFFNTAFLKYAYEDKAFPIGAGQTISQPYTVAVQTQLLQIKKGDKVLEIGTGSGYQTCILHEMGAKVFTIERQKELFDLSKALLPKLGYRPKFFYGDGYAGLEAFAPFDKIIVTAGAPYIPEPLKKQLKINGLLVIPVGQGSIQTMILIERKSECEFSETQHGAFRFVPLLTEKER